jgi:TPP-dependent pyruvate/acetoin dehydrogenase alpha subunit
MHMQENGELTDDELHKLDDEMKAVVQDAWDFAEQSPEPPLEALYEDVLVDTTSEPVEQSSSASEASGGSAFASRL